MQIFQRLRRRLFVFQLFLLLLGSCAVAYGSLRVFEGDLEPEMTRKGDLIARSLASQFERALDARMPFDRLRGVEDLFASMRQANREIVFIAAVDAQGATVFYDGKPERSAILPQLVPWLTPSAQDERGVARKAVRVDTYLLVKRPIVLAGQVVATTIVGVDADFVQQKILDIFYDVLIVLFVSLLLTFELLLLIMASASAPIHILQTVFAQASGAGGAKLLHRQRKSAEIHRLASGMRSVVDTLHQKYTALARLVENTGDRVTARSLAQAAAALDALKCSAESAKASSVVDQHSLVRVRMPMFVFFCAEELSRPFFPIFAHSLAVPIEGLSPQIVVSLPMMLFMLVVAFAQPLGGPWAERIGGCRLMIIGALIGACGLALTATAHSLAALLVWRFITAAGYGLVFVAGQSHIVANTDASNRSWGLAMFVGSVLAASICGPAIGGILADRIGYRLTFAAGSGIALLAALLAWRLLWDGGPRPARQSRPLRLRDVGVVLRNPRFLALIGFGAMPAKIILTGFLYYLAPLYLADLGNTPSAAGRIMMLYGLMMVLMTPLAARVVDRAKRPLLFVVGGGILSGIGLMGILISASTQMVVVGIVVLGIAQAISITPQLALVPAACPDECKSMGQVTVIGFFRLFERIGSALGPVLAAFLLQQFGYGSSIVAIGAGVIGSCLLLAAGWHLCSERRWGRRRAKALSLSPPAVAHGD